MNRISASLCLCCAIFLFASSPAAAVTISWVPVGDPGNAPDPANAIPYGDVGYAYKIGTYDVTNSQYVEFLNAKDPTGTNTLGLYNTNMSDPSLNGGISFSAGNANGSKYSIVSGRGSQPANFTTWYDAIRFANWLNNGQGSGDTETGAYTLLGGTPTPSNGLTITRNVGATVFLPNVNEWYKAAYYNPTTSSYFLYPTSSDTAPTAEFPPGGSNSANYSFVIENTTDVGAYTRTMSPFGAFDMGGNVWQWTETLDSNGRDRDLRGGSFSTADSLDSSGNTNSDTPTNEFKSYGFRVASIPEPSTGLLAVLACAVILWWKNRLNP